MFNSEEPPRAKKRKEEQEEGGSLESCLTDDLLLNCVARVSRSDLATLSLASKSYRSLVASPDLYKFRSLIGRTETYVYICLRTPGPESAFGWYIPGPDPTLTWYILRRGKTSSDLIPILSPPSSSLPLEGSSVVVLDWGIYVIGGFINGEEQSRSSDVWLLDCRTHTWRTVPSMGVARAYGAAGVVDGKIYVLGGRDVIDDHWGQVFDPKTQTWDTLPPPMAKGKIVNNTNIHDSLVRDHKVYAVDGMDRTYYYSPREVKWGTGNRGEQIGCRRDWCMVDNLIYCISTNGTLFWCEADDLDLCGEEMMMNTKEVKGLDSLKTSLLLSKVVHVGDQMLHSWELTKIENGHPPNKKSKSARIRELEDLIPGARLINSGGGNNIVLFWDHFVDMDCLEIWCAEISLERCQGDEIWGKIECSSVVMTFKPWRNHYRVLHSVSVTL